VAVFPGSDTALRSRRSEQAERSPVRTKTFSCGHGRPRPTRSSSSDWHRMAWPDL